MIQTVEIPYQVPFDQIIQGDCQARFLSKFWRPL